MNLLRKLAAATVAAAALAVPAVARVDAGTPALIRTAEAHGMSFLYNSPRCGGDFQGLYEHAERRITVCYKTADADAHDTIRHEIWHGIQACAARKKGTPFEPIARRGDLSTFVHSQLSDEMIIRIKSVYPKERHLVELEAFAAAEAYTAAQMIPLVEGWCGV